MDSTSLPEKIDPWRFATQYMRLRGVLPLARMTRLRVLLAADPDSSAGVTLDMRGGVANDSDTASVRYIEGTLRCVLGLTCQRCLQALTLPLDIDFRWGLALGEIQLAQLPSDYDYEPLLATGEIELAELIEDELLLALPLVPKHEPGPGCPAVQQRHATAAEPTQRSTPFASLSGLRKQG